MATSGSGQQEQVPVRIVNRLGDAFERAQEQIREQAYRIFLGREPGEGDSVSDWMEAQSRVFSPLLLDLKEQKKNIVVEGSLKGFSPNEIEIDVGGGELRVFGSHSETDTTSQSGASQTKEESTYFYQSIPLPCEIEPEKCTATLYKNGKLKVTLPRRTPLK